MARSAFCLGHPQPDMQFAIATKSLVVSYIVSGLLYEDLKLNFGSTDFSGKLVIPNVVSRRSPTRKLRTIRHWDASLRSA